MNRPPKSKIVEHIEDEDDCGVCELLGSKKIFGNNILLKNKEKQNSNSKGGETKEYWKEESPPDINSLGNAGWSIIHSFAAYFPDNPTEYQQKQAKLFINSFSNLFPCNYCSKDFRDYIKDNPVKTETRKDFCMWTCEAHNDVNVKLGKPEFDCNDFDKRWRRSK